MCEYVWIYNNRQCAEYVSYHINSARHFYKLMSTYWEIFEAYSEPVQRSKMEHFRKIIKFFNYFCKNSILTFLGGFWTCESSEYLYIFVNMRGFSIYVGMQLCKSSEYSKIPSMPGFSICKHCTRFWIWLNILYDRVLNMPDQRVAGF